MKDQDITASMNGLRGQKWMGGCRSKRSRGWKDRGEVIIKGMSMDVVRVLLAARSCIPGT